MKSQNPFPWGSLLAGRTRGECGVITLGEYLAGVPTAISLREDARASKKKRRPKELHTGKVTSPKERALGNLLKEIAEYSIRHQQCWSTSQIAKALNRKPKYKRLGERQMHRDVTTAINWTIENLQSVPLELWRRRLRVDPPRILTERALKQKALEHLRNELLSKKQ